MSTRALLELPRSEVFKWSAVYLASRQGLKRDIFGGEVFANTDVFSAIDAEQCFVSRAGSRATRIFGTDNKSGHVVNVIALCKSIVVRAKQAKFQVACIVISDDRYISSH